MSASSSSSSSADRLYAQKNIYDIWVEMAVKVLKGELEKLGLECVEISVGSLFEEEGATGRKHARTAEVENNEAMKRLDSTISAIQKTFFIKPIQRGDVPAGDAVGTILFGQNPVGEEHIQQILGSDEIMRDCGIDTTEKQEEAARFAYDFILSSVVSVFIKKGTNVDGDIVVKRTKLKSKKIQEGFTEQEISSIDTQTLLMTRNRRDYMRAVRRDGAVGKLAMAVVDATLELLRENTPGRDGAGMDVDF